jgi:dihydroflavonol-4-reductase
MIVVTGGTGLVGSHLLYELTKQGLHVRAIKRPTSNISAVKQIFSIYNNQPNTQFNLIEWIDADVLDFVSLEEAFSGAEKVYHAAAYVSFAASQKQKVYEINIKGTANVVNACLSKGVKKLCHVSSVAAIGNTTDGLAADESMIWTPSKNHSVYSISKFHSEMEVWRGIEEGLEAVIVNPSVIIGPGDWDKSSTALFSAIYNGLKFYPSGSTGFVDVRDVALAMVQLMDSSISGERFILNASEKKYKYIFSLIAQSLNKPAPSFAVKRWMAEIGWRIEWFKSFLIRTQPKITRETVSSGFNNSAFSNKKITQRTFFQFIPIEQSIIDTGTYFLKFNNKI